MSSVESATSLRARDRAPASMASPKDVARGARPTTASGHVRSSAFSQFTALANAFGGDATALLAAAGIDAPALHDDHGSLPYREVEQLLEQAADVLACPDFGLRLAAAQASHGATRAFGPLGVAMRHATTLREALQYAADHIHAYGSALKLCLEKLPDDGRIFLLLEMESRAPAPQRQGVEHALALLRHAVAAITGSQARPCEIWFSHEALAPLPVYRSHLNTTLRFGRSMTGLLFDEQDLDLPLPEHDAQLHEIATHFIDQRFPPVPRRLGTRVRIIVTHLLAAGSCTHDRVAATLGLHPRTLQRRLRDEGESFEAIKDQVRRDVALRHLGQSNVSLVKMTEILGYSETSVLTRSCHRWFSASPRQLRKRQWRGVAEASPCTGAAVT